MSGPELVVVTVPRARLARWVENFEARHGATGWHVEDGALEGRAEDGSRATMRLPFEMSYDGPPDATLFAAHVVGPERWGVLLVRKGGFAVARLAGERIEESKVGQRHVQGRTKAGGQSQQRFARRRENQARVAYEAAADHAARVLRPGPVVLGGDLAAVSAVLEDPRLAGLAPVGPVLPVADPRRSVLDDAVAQALGVHVVVHNA